MLDDALFERFPCDAVFSLHNRPNIPLGHAVVNHGVMMAGASIFTINIRGVGGHGARPHLTVDPILVAGQLIQGLQSIVSRRIDPLEPAVVSLGSVHGGAAVNVIPECVELTGTVRCFDDRIMSQIETEVRQICKGGGARGRCYRRGRIQLRRTAGHQRQAGRPSSHDGYWSQCSELRM